VADGGRDGEIRYLGEFDAPPESVRRLTAKLASRYDRLHVCYEAGPTGYGLYRQIIALGHHCIVVAPSLIPQQPTAEQRVAIRRERIKPLVGDLHTWMQIERTRLSRHAETAKASDDPIRRRICRGLSGD
jgi:transposase